MVRHRQRKTDKGKVPDDVMRAAVRAVLNDKRSIRKVSEEFEIKKSTLARYVMKSKHVDWNADPMAEGVKFKPSYDVRRIFDEEEEVALKEYLTKAARLHHGLPPKEARKLAYEYAQRLQKEHG